MNLLWIIPAVAISLWLAGPIYAKIGGWQQLSVEFPRNVRTVGDTFRFRSGLIGKCKYKLLSLTANDDGVLVSAPFSLGHPPFFVRWDDMRELREYNYCFGFVHFVGAKIGTNDWDLMLHGKAIPRSILDDDDRFVWRSVGTTVSERFFGREQEEA